MCVNQALERAATPRRMVIYKIYRRNDPPWSCCVLYVRFFRAKKRPTHLAVAGQWLDHLQLHHLRRYAIVDQFLLEPYSGGVSLEALKKDTVSSLPANLKPIRFLFAGFACAFVGQDGYLHSFHSSGDKKEPEHCHCSGSKAL